MQKLGAGVNTKNGDRQGQHNDGREPSGTNAPPLPVGEQHDRNKKPKLRLVSHQAKQNAADNRTRWQRGKEPAEQSCGKKAVLAGIARQKRGRRGKREQYGRWSAYDGLDG